MHPWFRLPCFRGGDTFFRCNRRLWFHLPGSTIGWGQTSKFELRETKHLNPKALHHPAQQGTRRRLDIVERYTCQVPSIATKERQKAVTLVLLKGSWGSWETVSFVALFGICSLRGGDSVDAREEDPFDIYMLLVSSPAAVEKYCMAFPSCACKPNLPCKRALQGFPTATESLCNASEY